MGDVPDNSMGDISDEIKEDSVVEASEVEPDCTLDANTDQMAENSPEQALENLEIAPEANVEAVEMITSDNVEVTNDTTSEIIAPETEKLASDTAEINDSEVKEGDTSGDIVSAENVEEKSEDTATTKAEEINETGEDHSEEVKAADNAEPAKTDEIKESTTEETASSDITNEDNAVAPVEPNDNETPEQQ